MVLGGAIFGAFVGWFLTEFELYGFLIGGMFGLIGGWLARKAVRAEIAEATAALRTEIVALRTASFMEPAPDTMPEPEPVPIVRVAPPPPPPARSPDAPTPERAYRPKHAHHPERADSNAEPAKPGALAQAIGTARAWLFGGNTIVRMGLVILFVGLSFLARYAASAGLFPVELRLALIGMVGTLLLAVGFRTRIVRPAFGLALQGGGVAIVYLTLFGAARLFDVVPLLAAFALMIAVCALAVALALLQRSQALAVTAFAGGFAVPLLLSDGSGDVAGLFAFYTVLNLAILFVAWRRAWRGLNLTGFFATFGMASMWWTSGYTPADFVAAQVFLIVSVLIYVATAMLHTRATPGKVGHAVETTLLFGPAIAGFGLQVVLVDDRPFGSAFAALGFAALYLGVAAFTFRHRRESARVMREAMLAIGIGFVTLAVPLALGARWTSAAWALEGAGAFWVGMRQARWVPRLFGLLLQGVAALVYVASAWPNVSAMPVAIAGFIGALLIAIAMLATAWWLRRQLPHSGSRWGNAYARGEAMLGVPVFLAGYAFWWMGWIAEATRLSPPLLAGAFAVPVFGAALQCLLVMLAYVLSAWGWQAVGRRIDWQVATWPGRVTVIVLALAFAAMRANDAHLLDAPMWAVWLVAIAVHLRIMYLNDRGAGAPGGQRLATGSRITSVWLATASRITSVWLATASHVASLWLATAMLADMLWSGVEHARLWDTSWAGVVFLASGVAVLAALTMWPGRVLQASGREASRRRWPLDTHAVAYGWYAAVPVAGSVVLGTLATALFASGETAPLPYLPIVNPVDLALGLALAVLALWRRSIVAAVPAPQGSQWVRKPAALAALAGLAFVVVNTVWLRAAHQLLGIAWDGDALLASFVVQTGLAILWTTLALVLMVVAHRRAQRMLWLAGAGLLALTVAKLLLVDLTNAGGAARIVAFMVVGGLMLVVGYAAPLPPRIAAPDEELAVA